MKIVTYIFFFICHTSFAQISKVLVVDNESLSAIAYCMVFSFSNNHVQYSDKFGYLYLEKGKSDTFFFRHTGYADTVISFKFLTDTIKLQRKITRLREVVVRGNTKEYQIGNFSYKKINRLYHWTSVEFIRRIDINENSNIYKVNSIFIPLGFNPKYKDSCNCIVRLYKLNVENQLEDVLTNSIVINYENLKKNFLIDIQDQNIYLNDSILYVGLDCFLNIPFQVLNNHYSYDIERHKKYLKHLNTAPIWFYFDMKAKFDKENGLSFGRNKNQIDFKNRKSKWFPTMFTAGIVVKSYQK